MELDPYRFEMIFTGLCLFVLEKDSATVLLVNASNPKRFRVDADLVDAGAEMPSPHYPQLGYSMTQQIRQGVVPRIPDRVTSGPSGEEIGICDLEGEELSLELPGAPAFRAGPLQGAPSISSLVPVRLHPLASGPLPNHHVAARLHIDRGALETLRVAYAGLVPLEVDLRTVRTRGKPSGNPPSVIADQLVLRADGVTKPVKVRSSGARSLLLRPDLDTNGKDLRTVRVSLANYHRRYHRPADAAYDFLWFYELVEFQGPAARPSRIDLPLPVYTNGSGGFTGSSGVCPPLTL